MGRNLSPAEVLGLIVQITEALAFAHACGLVHRDLKPANVLVDGELLKLADFGIGDIMVGHATAHSQILRSMVDKLHADEQVSLLRGSGTPLYMDPDQRRGSDPNARHDLYSLVVAWYQLLVGDVTKELHGGWDDELESEYGVPRSHVDVMKKCVGLMKNRPANGAELLVLLQSLSALSPKPTPPPTPAAGSPWHTTENRDNGSLRTGAIRVEIGDVIEINGEGKHRTVTYVMGSPGNWHATFKNQGAVPEGQVEWRIVSRAATKAPQPPEETQPLQPPSRGLRLSAATKSELERAADTPLRKRIVAFVNLVGEPLPYKPVCSVSAEGVQVIQTDYLPTAVTLSQATKEQVLTILETAHNDYSDHSKIRHWGAVRSASPFCCSGRTIWPPSAKAISRRLLT